MDLLHKRERAVPQTRTLRHGKTVALLARMGLNAARTRTANAFRSTEGQRAAVMSEDNIALIVDHISLMRGAAVKLAQKLNSMRNVMLVNEQLQLALDKSVLSNVYAMPRAQLVESLEQQLGPDWRARFGVFNLTAFAAASLGEVHLATLGANATTGEEAQVVVLKVQYPGVRESIDSDTEGLLTLLGATVNAESMYFELNQRMIVASRETWAQECDYAREVQNLRTYAALLEADAEADLLLQHFELPRPIPALSAERVLCMTFVRGEVLDVLCRSRSWDASQAVRNTVAERLLRLKFKELFSWHFMNADPHLGNFHYNDTTGSIGLVDFGNCKHIDPADSLFVAQQFLDAANGDQAAFVEALCAQGLAENTLETLKLRVEHFEFMQLLARPFASAKPFDFRAWYEDPMLQDLRGGNQAAWSSFLMLPGARQDALCEAIVALVRYLVSKP